MMQDSAVDPFKTILCDLSSSANEAKAKLNESNKDELFNDWCILAVNLIQNRMTNTAVKVSSLQDTLRSF